MQNPISVTRALAVLDLFGAESPALGADAICAMLGCSVPTGYRYIRELVSAGLLRRLPRALYGLGPRIVLLDYIMRRTDPLLAAAQPVMRALADRSGCDCVLSALYDMQIIDTHRETATAPLALAYGRGRPRPLFLGAAPKVILASQPLAFLRRLHGLLATEIQQAGLGGDFAAFRAEMTAIRKCGFHISRGELEAELSAVAAPIPVHDPDLPAAIALVTTSARFDVLNHDALIAMVRQAAAEIADQLERPSEE